MKKLHYLSVYGDEFSDIKTEPKSLRMVKVFAYIGDKTYKTTIYYPYAETKLRALYRKITRTFNYYLNK